MVVIRLARAGKKGEPVYKITVADKAAKLTGRFIEKIGTYKPGKGQQGLLKIDTDRLDHWTKLGAQPSERVEKLIKLHRSVSPAK
jgi:small subunit ribosomal protein S16